jgi:hypothetical protein
MGPIQWGAWLSIYRAQEEHVAHLVLPAWQAGFGQLWSSLGGQRPRQGQLQGFVAWPSLLLRRAAGHSNAAMRRAAFCSLAELQVSVGLDAHPSSAAKLPCSWCLQDGAGWLALQQLFLEDLLPALDHKGAVSCQALVQL